MNEEKTSGNSSAVSVPTKAITSVMSALLDWRDRKPQEVYDAAERVWMSLNFCLFNRGLGVRELAADVELMRRARFADQWIKYPPLESLGGRQ